MTDQQREDLRRVLFQLDRHARWSRMAEERENCAARLGAAISEARQRALFPLACQP
jgi:hypothetical protein